MEQRNEPTTAEIVSFLMEMPESTFWSYTRVGKVSHEEIAACIERLERDLETFKAFHERYAEQTSKKYVEDICALTARAEKAEAERNAAVANLFQVGSTDEEMEDNA